jgi:hypothetical protein
MKRESTYYQTASHNLVLIHYLRELIERLKKKGPEVLFFRGISLLGDVYPELGDRGMLDVDILVKGKDQGKLKKILKMIGMEEIEEGNFNKPGLLVDVHTSFLNPSRTTLERSCLTISLDDVFKKGTTKKLDAIEIKIPCPLHLFISTAIHLQSHSFGSEKGWEDLNRIQKYYGLSDETISVEANKMGAEHTLAYLTFLRPDLFSSWREHLSFGERWILKRIKGGKFNQNFGDLLFLFQSKHKGKALQEIFFPHGISSRIIVDRSKKGLLLLREIIPGLKAQTIKDHH